MKMSSSSESEMSFDSDDSDMNFILQFEKSAILQATKDNFKFADEPLADEAWTARYERDLIAYV